MRLHPFNGGHRQLGRPLSELATPIRNERLGADQQGSADVPLAGKQAQRHDSLHGLAQAHLIGEDRFTPWIKIGDAVKLIREWPKGKRERSRRQQVFEGRLEEVSEAVFEFYDIARRVDAGASLSRRFYIWFRRRRRIEQRPVDAL
jgi:hypothetical protein